MTDFITTSARNSIVLQNAREKQCYLCLYALKNMSFDEYDELTCELYGSVENVAVFDCFYYVKHTRVCSECVNYVKTDTDIRCRVSDTGHVASEPLLLDGNYSECMFYKFNFDLSYCNDNALRYLSVQQYEKRYGKPYPLDALVYWRDKRYDKTWNYSSWGYVSGECSDVLGPNLQVVIVNFPAVPPPDSYYGDADAGV